MHIATKSGKIDLLFENDTKKLANTININVPKDVLSEKERRDIIINLKSNIYWENINNK